jgi:hypothetical protein
MNSLTKWLKITNQYSKTDEDEKPSHLLLNGYKLYIKDENLSIFNKKYAETISQNEKLYIVECKKQIFKLFFDLDFLLSKEQYDKIKEDIENKSENIFMDIIKIINDVIYDFYEEYHDCIVTTADDKKVKKIIKNEENPENINSKELIKKGFHLHFPNINTNKNMALEIRKTCILKINKYNDFFENSINDILDEHVFASSGLRLTGSRKGHFVTQTKEFVDEGRPYNLLYILRDNEINEDIFKELNENMLELINKTSIITTDEYITNIKHNPNLECDECDDENDNESGNAENFQTGSWKRLKKDDVKYEIIIHYFSIYLKDYNKKDIKRIFYSDNESIYILCSQSKYCTNIGKNHNSEHIYFKLNKDGICQKCFCRCDTTDGRKHGYCKDYESDKIPCTPHLSKVLNFKEVKVDKTKILKNNKNNNEDLNINSIFENLRNDWYNQFTAKDRLLSKKTVKKKS